MLFPTGATANTLGQATLGLGAVKSNCEFAADLDSEVCLSGARLHLGLHFTQYPDGTAKSGTSLFDSDSRPGNSGGNSCGSGNCNGGNCNPRVKGCTNFNTGGGRGADIFVAVIAVALVALLLYGIWFMLATLFADKLKMGFVISSDFQTSGKIGGQDIYEDYGVQRYGVQMGLYMIPDVPIQLHANASYTNATISKRVAETKDRYDVEGYSTAFGLGWVPEAKDSGFFAYLEYGQTFFNHSTLRSYVESQNENPPLPTARKSGSFVLGYAF